MEAEVIPTVREDYPPAPLVQLTMTLREFAVYEALRYQNLNGFSPLRSGIERVVDEIIAGLDPYWRDRIEAARESSREPIIDRVERAFGA